MCSVVLAENDICLPDWVNDFRSFRRWTDSADFPDEGRISFLGERMWIDMSREQLHSHGELKTNVAAVLTRVALMNQLGRYVCDGVRLVNPGVGLSHVPDGLLYSVDSIKQERVKLVPGYSHGFVEMEGSPDMVLEIVRDASVKKDTEILMDLYWRAGISEYWLIDARDHIRFDIYRRQAKGYVATPKQAGWVRSKAFGRSFRLTKKTDELGLPQFVLKAKT